MSRKNSANVPEDDDSSEEEISIEECLYTSQSNVSQGRNSNNREGRPRGAAKDPRNINNPEVEISTEEQECIEERRQRESNLNQGGPSNDGQGSPSNETQGNPSNATQRKPSYTTQRKPSNAAQRKPSNATQRKPSNASQRRSSNASQRRSSNASKDEASKASQGKQSNLIAENGRQGSTGSQRKGSILSNSQRGSRGSSGSGASKKKVSMEEEDVDQCESSGVASNKKASNAERKGKKGSKRSNLVGDGNGQRVSNLAEGSDHRPSNTRKVSGGMGGQDGEGSKRKKSSDDGNRKQPNGCNGDVCKGKFVDNDIAK